MTIYASSVSAYSSWRKALRGEFGPAYESDPQPGYYRMRRGKGGPRFPVAIWTEGGAALSARADLGGSSGDQCGGVGSLARLSCHVSGIDRDPYEIWTWCCRYPVTYEAYVAVAERGEGWPEDLPVSLHAELERFDRTRPVTGLDRVSAVSTAAPPAYVFSAI